ncbi:MAG: hypothetical protein WD894_20250 [Pirellulales bacterium]
MPRYRRPLRSQRPDVAVLSIDHEYQLDSGSTMLSSTEPMDLDTFKAAWEFHRDRLLAQYIRRQPGRRSFAWWLLDHGIERPVVNRFTDEAELRRETDGGGCLRGASCPFGFLHTHLYGGPDMLAFQEDETDYLRRHGLLTAVEEIALRRESR